MVSERQRLELLAPAKNLAAGCEAILHGADAVYIGGPAFGARAAAGNGVADIAQLAEFAHRFRARVLVALNTILGDAELEQARQLVWQLYDAGADALIVQDMGLLQLDLPPIALHASTQTDNRSLEKVRFLESAGFSQIVLARELSLPQIRAIADQTQAKLEFFVHGALCVSYSGQCYLSYARTGRSANRGECAQLCRLPYALEEADGKVLAQDTHLLSLKDMNQSENLLALIQAGISSFKIEGRLKDLSYVKNVTAHYRHLLDQILHDLPGYRRASQGRSDFLFTPQPAKSFNRGFTDYFVPGRQAQIGAFLSPKFLGEPIGRVKRLAEQYFEIETDTSLHNGDGLSWFNAAQELVGLRINRAEGVRLIPAEMPLGLRVGDQLYRNRDQEFEKILEKKSAERRIDVDMQFIENAQGFTLIVQDEEGIQISESLLQEKIPAQDAERALMGLRQQLAKLGNTCFRERQIDLKLNQGWFFQASVLNDLRRRAVAALELARHQAYQRPLRQMPAASPLPFPQETLSYLGNVNNQAARQFYQQHGVQSIDPAFEQNQENGDVSLMICKHCLRYSFNLCPKQVKGLRPDPLWLVRGKERYALRFDCKRCEMHVTGKLKEKS